MSIRSLDGLFNTPLDELATAAFEGGWDLLCVRDALQRGQAVVVRQEAEALRLLLNELKRRFPFNYRKAYLEPGRERALALANSFGDEGDVSPTPFLPVLLLIAACQGPVIHLSDDELDMLAGYGIAAISKVRASERTSVAAAALLSDVCRLLRKHGQLEIAQALAELGVTQVKAAASEACAAADLYDALYDARAAVADRDATVSDAERLSASTKMLNFVDNELAPAIRRRNDLFAASTNIEVRRCVRESQIALEHRRLTWETAESVSARGWPTDATSKWLALAQAYDSIDNGINAANALSAAVDELTFLVESGAKLWEELDHVLLEFSGRLAGRPWPTEADRRELLRRVPLAELALLRVPSHASFRDIFTSLRDELEQADVLHRRFVLASADDYLGIALRAFGVEHDSFTSLYELLRGEPLQPVMATADATVLRLFVTRFGSAVVVGAGDGKTLSTAGEASHELGRTLSAVARRARIDIAESLENKTVPAPSPEWPALIGSLAGRLGLRKLGSLLPSPKRVVVQLDGLGVHLPIAGPLLDVWEDVEAIALTRFGFVGAPAPFHDSVRVAVLGGFPASDWWAGALQRAARHLGTQVDEFATVDSLRAHLEAPASFIVVGAHGYQDGVAGDLCIQIGPDTIPVEAVLSGVKLPAGATVFLAICFAGSGQALPIEGWQSLPELLLAAGARTVVANRWPAWAEQQTERDFLDYLTRLRGASIASSAWAAAEETTRFAKRLRQLYRNPRQWAGWGTWMAPQSVGL